MNKGISLAICFFIIIVIQNPCYSKLAMNIDEISGNAFASLNEQTWPLERNAQLTDLTEIMTEDSSYLSISDISNRKYHLLGGGHLKFMNKIIELKKGNLWLTTTDSVEIHTANAIASCEKSDVIVMFDYPDVLSEGRTQLFVLKGECTFKNLLQDGLAIRVMRGEFTFISSQYDEGMPRQSTPIGDDSFAKLMAQFHHVPLNGGSDHYKKENEMKSRSIASVISPPVPAAAPVPETTGTEGKIIKHQLKERETALNFDIEKFNQGVIDSLPKPKPTPFNPFKYKSKTPIFIYGKNLKRGNNLRMPSSIKGPMIKSSKASKTRKTSEVGEVVEERRHKNEVEQLLQDLKKVSPSFDGG